MLEVAFRDGRGRVARWKPGEGQELRSPGLLWPENSLASPPAWVQAVVTAAPTARKGVIELVSGGTWFYPLNEGAPGLVVPAPQPGPTVQVQVLSVGQELAVFHDAGGWATNPKNLAGALVEARTQATPGRLLWAPALGTPQDYALWAYLGMDLFDVSPLLLAAVRGTALSLDGELSIPQAERLFGGTWDVERLVAHNLEEARLELERVRSAIEAGTLRALVERRVYGRASMVEVLRRFDREHGYLEAATPRNRAATLPCMTAESLTMPEVEAFRRRFRDAYEPPASTDILVLLPCSAKKPYKTSRSHRKFIEVLENSGIRGRIHEVMVTSPLGLVSRELEDVYPANRYDVPVTGHWLRDEEAIVREQLAALLSKRPYAHVVVHMGQATFDVVRDLLPEETRHTSLHHPTSDEDLTRLGEELARLKAALPAKTVPDRRLEDLRALASFQFGATVAADLTDGARSHGRLPFLKLEGPEGQRGQTTPERGVLSLTPAGAAALVRHGVNRVFLKSFQIKSTSSLFAVGVESCDPAVRPGDEVALVQDGALRGCGVAEMPAAEMTALKRGVAVTVRHLTGGAA